jgi:hypothetical protein
MFKENFLAPTMLAAYNEPIVTEYEYGYLNSQKVGRIYSHIARSIGPFHVSEKLLEVQQIINNQIVPQIINGKLNAKKALLDAVSTLRKTDLNLEQALMLNIKNDLQRAVD